MKKYTIISLSSLLLVGMAAFSCSKSLDNSGKTLTKGIVKANIPATFASSKVVADGGAATFSASEKVYVYNDSSSTLDTKHLSPDSDGTTANLNGSLSGAYLKGDILKLLYNTTSEGIADYTNQNGTLENVVDAATATVKITSVDGDNFTTSKAYFENLQSIFRFTFKDTYNNPVKVKKLTILSENNNLQKSYNVIDETMTYGGVSVICDTAQSTVYVSCRFANNPSEMILFSVIDENGKVYTGSKTSPPDGFKNGRFYSSTISVESHVFSVSATKKVYLSPGNLYCKDGVYHIQSLPWEINADESDIFKYSDVESNMSSSAKSITINGIGGWYVPESSEWQYLIEGRKYDSKSSTLHPYRIVSNANYGNVFGLLFLPDDFSYDEDRVEIEREDKYSTDSGMDYYKININLIKYLAKGCAFIPEYDRTPSYNSNHYWSSNWYYSNSSNTQKSVTLLSFSKTAKTGGYGVTPRIGYSYQTKIPTDISYPIRLIHE